MACFDLFNTALFRYSFVFHDGLFLLCSQLVLTDEESVVSLLNISVLQTGGSTEPQLLKQKRLPKKIPEAFYYPGDSPDIIASYREVLILLSPSFHRIYR